MPVHRTVSADDLARLKREREDADRLYNEALTALDAAVQRLPEIPHPPPAPDEYQVTPLNELWHVLPPEGGFGRGWRRRLKQAIWNLVGPPFRRQEQFNSALVDHVNRNIHVQRETQKAIATTIALVSTQIADLVAFESRLMVYLQQLTPYVDTKDREVTGLMRRIAEDNAEMLDVVDHRVIGLAAGISGVGDELQKRWESMVAREKRFEARVGGVSAAVEEFRTSLAVLQRSSLAMKRELERLLASAETGAPALPPVSAVSGAGTGALASAQAARPLADSHKYVGFEDQFRGSEDEIRARVAEYLPYFEGASDVLDVGCGRGEFLDLLRARGIPARGLDINREMVEACRQRGLDVSEGDALGCLLGLPSDSLGGLFAAQVIEHLEPDYLLSFLDAAYDKLRPGARVVLETINAACWVAFFESYIRDITHVRPLHPDTMKYLLQASGFQRVDIRFRAPYPVPAKLQGVAIPSGTQDTGPFPTFASTFNENVEKVNARLFTYLDYAVVGEKL
ncbi:MAG: class I SAM-dependent methyltransferase [Acidobacteria bacterium]|nr:class I SAM-dependent methyltransferase [Acidobacteriota bacterium]